jgi:alpha-mannosidase
LRISGRIGEMMVTTLVTAYAELDRLDFDVRVRKPPGSAQERLTQVFPVAASGAVERLETPGAVVRPYPQPKGDLLDGADQRRFAVQGFVDVSLPSGPGVTIAPLEAYVLRRDLGPVTFEALGNDQNYREVIRDQDGVSEFRFRYALRAHVAGYEGPAAFVWSRSVTTPLLVGRGQMRGQRLPTIQVDPQRAVATCLKPAEEREVILRLWETAGKAGPMPLGVNGYRRAVRTDLLERDLERLALTGGRVTVHLPAHGFAAVRLLP